MEPALRDGDAVVVDLRDGSEARVGDVVLVLDDDGHTILHRVIARSRGALVTHGDARLGPDAPVALERVLGIARVPRRPLLARLRRLRAAL